MTERDRETLPAPPPDPALLAIEKLDERIDELEAKIDSRFDAIETLLRSIANGQLEGARKEDLDSLTRKLRETCPRFRENGEDCASLPFSGD